MKEFLDLEFNKKSFSEIDIHEIIKLYLLNEYKDNSKEFFFNNTLIDSLKNLKDLKIEHYSHDGCGIILTNKKEEVFCIGEGIKDEIYIICHNSSLNNNLKYQMVLSVAKKDDDDNERNIMASSFSLTTHDRKNKFSFGYRYKFDKKKIKEEKVDLSLEMLCKDINKNIHDKNMFKDIESYLLKNKKIDKDFLDIINLKYDTNSNYINSLLSFIVNDNLKLKDINFIKKILKNKNNLKFN